MTNILATPLANTQWVIFSKEQAEPMGLEAWLSPGESFGGYWTPGAEQVMRVEEQVGAYLSQNPQLFYSQPPVWERLNEYKRQYVGWVLDGKQVIYGNFFCDDTGRDWKQDWVMVLDGGECFFQVKFDVTSGTFIELQVNGEA